MAGDMIKLYWKFIAFIVPYSAEILVRRFRALYHRWVYRALPDAKNVVVLGGSYAGTELAKRLIESLPTGYKCILVEKNSHFNYVFNFPRYSVLEGHEYKAFIPYEGIGKNAPEGILTWIRDTAVELTKTDVILASGKKIPYAYLVIATGSAQPLPGRVASSERDEACRELQSLQSRIKAARRIAIVGAGAVGVELASDIADFCSDKEVTLFHSRDQLLNQFGKKLHDYVLPALQKLNVTVRLKERPRLEPQSRPHEGTTLTFADGHTENFDLVVPCTGQIPNSSFLSTLHPDSISPQTARILVTPGLQLRLASSGEVLPNIFAIGDVAEHQGPRMARAAFFQVPVVSQNILSLIRGRAPTSRYVPRWDFEAALKLTLGRSHHVVYATNDRGGESSAEGNSGKVESNEKDLLIVGHKGKLDLDVERAWKYHGADIRLLESIAGTLDLKAES